MVKGKEHLLIEKSMSEIKCDESVTGVVMEVFEFTEDAEKEPMEGRLLRPTHKSHISITEGKFDVKTKKRLEVKMKCWTRDLSRQAEIRKVISRGLRFRHRGILKPLLCAEVDSLSKVVFGSTNFQYTFQEWLSHRSSAEIIEGEDYLSGQVKNMIRSGLSAIDYIWNIGCTCDELDKPSSYVVDGPNLIIVPLLMRCRQENENNNEHKVALRTQFADLLDGHIGPKWKDPEFRELTSLMRNPRASLEIILGSPVLSNPVERQLMYRDAASSICHMTTSQVDLFNMRVSVRNNWFQEAKFADPVIQKNFTGNFSRDASGALKFAKIVSSHYVEDMKRMLQDSTVAVAMDLVDRMLKTRFPLLLWKWYALKFCDPDFIIVEVPAAKSK